MKTLSLIILSVIVAGAIAQSTTDEVNPAEPTATPSPAPDANKNKTTTATTTQATTTTTAPPTPLPAPTAGKWNVSQGGNLCILAKLGAKFSFNYTDTADKNQTYEVNLPANETASEGSCGTKDTSQNIKLTYGGSCSMTLNFQKVKSKFSVNKIDLSFDTSCFPAEKKPKQTVTGTITTKLFEATTGQSYMCNSDQSLAANSSQVTSFTVEFVDVQLQAFANMTKFEFGAAQECPQDAETSNIVPIAVGAALAALVLIVLIAYLISRNRGQRGYESV